LKKCFTITLGFLAVLLCHNHSLAGWISEVQPQSRQVNNITRTETVTLPALIEVSGLSSLDHAEIIIVNASVDRSRHGRILQTVPIGAGGDVRLIQDSSLNLDGPRSLLLFDGITGLVANSGAIPNDLSPILAARLLDVVTYGPGGAASTLDGEPVLEWSPSQIIARPMRTQAQPWENQYIVGTPNIDGFVTDANPLFQLNPGLANPIWQPHHTPSPNTAALLVSALILMRIVMRTNHPSPRRLLWNKSATG